MGAVLIAAAGGAEADAESREAVHVRPPESAVIGKGGYSPATERPASDRLIVTFAEDATSAERRAAVRDLGGDASIDSEVELGLDDAEVVELDSDSSSTVDLEAAARELELDDSVVAAEPDMLFTLSATPDDPEFHRLWHLENTGQTVGQPGTPGADIGALEAWDVITDASAAPIAVIDTGVDFGLPETLGNAWTNPGETGDGREDNGIDDDDNGFIDDWRGWDFHGQDNGPTDFDGHGTMMAGAAAAAGNNATGGTGVAWTAGIMALKASRDTPGTAQNPITIGLISAVSAIAYADSAGARVVNMSFSSPGSSSALANAIQSRPHMMFVTAAGNGSEDNDDPYDQLFPCALPYGNLVCVTASNHKDKLAGISGTGRKNVDLAAPGIGIFTPHPITLDFPTGYVTGSGTSHSTAIFSGAAALVWSHFTPAEEIAVPLVRARILNNVNRSDPFAMSTSSGGRLDLFEALTALPRSVLGRSAKPKSRRLKPRSAGKVRVSVRSNGDLPLTNVRICGKASKKFVRSVGCSLRGYMQIGKSTNRNLQVQLKKKARPGRNIKVKVTVRAQGIAVKTKTVRFRVRQP